MTEKGRGVAGLRISVLGSPRVVADGRPVEVDTRKAIALLSFLAVTARPQGRERLTGLLWPDYEQDKARAALRRTLSALKSGLGARWIVADRLAISLELQDVDLDLARFRKLLEQVEAHDHGPDEACPPCAAALTAATTLVTGDFLAGFVLRDAEPFEEWQSLEAESVEREFASALDRLVRARVALGDLEGATSAIQQKLALDALDEPAHRQLMQVYAWRGMRTNALQHYRDCVAILDRELGVAPLRETTELYEAIADGRIEPLRKAELAAPAGVSPAAGRARTYRLHGRDREWERLEQAYADANKGLMVVVEGEAGIGKTRLARDFLEHAGSQGAATAAVRSHEGETGLPYALMTELLTQTVPRLRDLDIPAEPLAEAGRLVPALQRDAPPGSIEDPGGLARFYEGIRSVLTTALAGDRPAVVLLDDVHWCDAASVEALGYIVRRLPQTPLMLIATWRWEEVGANARLRRIADEAVRSGHGIAIPLGRLAEREVIELVAESGLPSERTGDIAQRLVEETEGIPFFLVEYLAVARSDPAGTWELPATIKDLLRSRVDLVGQTARQVLGTAAVIDRSFDFDVVWRASGRTELEVVDALEELVRHGLIAPAPAAAPDVSYDFSHEKLRTFMYDTLSPARKKVLHRRVAEAFAHAGRRDTQRRMPGLIARHYELGGNEADAASYRELAAERARAVYANREALDHYLAALSLGHPDPARMHRGAGDMYVLLGEYSKALNSYQAAAAHSPVEEVAVLEQRIGEVHQRRGDWDLSQNHFAAALESLPDAADVARSRLFSAMSFSSYRMGALDEARALAARALQASDEADDPRARAHAQNMIGILENAGGDHVAAEKALRESLRLVDELEDAGGRAAALNNLALAARSRGDLDRALELTLEALEICTQQGDRHHEAALHNNIADLLHDKGETEQAMQHLKQATATLAEIGDEPTGMLPEVWKLVEW